MNDLPIKLTPSTTSKYKALLQEDWTAETLNKVFDLFQQVALNSKWTFNFPWEQSAKPKSAPSKYPIIEGSSKALAEFLQKRNLELLNTADQPTPKRKDEEKIRLGQFANMTGFILNLKRFYKITGDLGFFRDMQSLLFLVAAEVLPPELKRHHQTNELVDLANAMHSHTLLEWDDYPSHKYFLQSHIFEFMGYRDKKRNSLHQAFIATSPDSHEYLTNAQAYLNCLLDEHDTSGSIDFILGVYRNAPMCHLEEIKDMLCEITAPHSKRAS